MCIGLRGSRVGSMLLQQDLLASLAAWDDGDQAASRKMFSSPNTS